MKKSEIFEKMAKYHNDALLMPEGIIRSSLMGKAAAYADMCDMMNEGAGLDMGSNFEVIATCVRKV